MLRCGLKEAFRVCISAEYLTNRVYRDILNVVKYLINSVDCFFRNECDTLLLISLRHMALRKRV